jgi:hypothetical protein
MGVLIFGSFDTFGPVFQALPDFLKETKHTDPKDTTQTGPVEGMEHRPASFCLDSDKP